MPEINNSFNSSKLVYQIKIGKSFKSFSFLNKKKKKNFFLKEYREKTEKNRKTKEREIISREKKISNTRSKSKIFKKKDEFMTYSFLEIEIKKFPFLFFRFFEPSYPFFMCFYTNYQKNQLNYGKIFRHKWNKKIIQSREKIFLSMGWNFFKTCVYFFSEKEKEKGFLQKYFKKSSEYSVCFRGPKNPFETGVVGCFRSLFCSPVKEKGSFFNIVFTGKIFRQGISSKIFKKIKLKGILFKSFKKTAFIKNMFSTEIEAFRFLGNTITGENREKGIIKNPVGQGPPGSFRAIFDKKIEIKKKVFLRVWIPLRFNDKILKNTFYLNSHDKREIQRKF